MQEPYHIGVSLQEYYRISQSGKWRIPDFSQRCLICGVGDCAKYHGIYERRAICPQSGFEVADLPVVRFLCRAKGRRKDCDHVTFSLLPLVLVPYRQLTLKFMMLALWLRLRGKLSFFAAMDAIEEELVNFQADAGDFVSIAAQLQWEKLISAGFYRFFVSGMFNEEQVALINKAPEKGLIVFLKMMIAYQSQRSDTPIRGPDGLAWDFYKLNGGGNKLAPFLFGTASQHRN
ncbi:MAG: hypothetical protein GY755_22345 [Chloroflexi bacterium]|nr:hypothetical protein [Chloroflexota bacterium]